MAWRDGAHPGARAALALLVLPLAACGAGAPDAVPAPPPVVDRPAPVDREPIVIPPAPTFADAPPEPGAPDAGASADPGVEPLLPTGAEAAAWSPAELVAWAGQPPGVALPAGGTWRSLSIGLQFAADGSGGLDGMESDLKVTTPEAVDAVVAQQVASPPAGSTVQEVVEAAPDGRRAVTVVLHTPGESADSVDVRAQSDGGSLLHVQHLPRRDGARPVLAEERVHALVSRLTQDVRPHTWRVRFARLTLTDTGAPAVMVAWSASGEDEAQAMATARAAFGHLAFGPVQVTPHRSTADFTYPGAAAVGAVSVDTESDGTTRVELEARG